MKKYKERYQEIMAKKFAKLHGWNLVKGYKVNHEGFEEDWDYSYWHKESIWDFIEKCEFWENDNDDEHSFEDVWDVVEYIEENSEENFDEWIKSPKTTIPEESKHNSDLTQLKLS